MSDKPELKHEPECAYLRSHPMDGDESSLCDCGAVRQAYEEWLRKQREEGSWPGSDKTGENL